MRKAASVSRAPLANCSPIVDVGKLSGLGGRGVTLGKIVRVGAIVAVGKRGGRVCAGVRVKVAVGEGVGVSTV